MRAIASPSLVGKLRMKINIIPDKKKTITILEILTDENLPETVRRRIKSEEIGSCEFPLAKGFMLVIRATHSTVAIVAATARYSAHFQVIAVSEDSPKIATVVFSSSTEKPIGMRISLDDIPKWGMTTPKGGKPATGEGDIVHVPNSKLNSMSKLLGRDLGEKRRSVYIPVALRAKAKKILEGEE